MVLPQLFILSGGNGAQQIVITNVLGLDRQKIVY